jgi:hypothetical protein
MSLRWLNHRYGIVGGGSALVGWATSECLGVRNGVVSGLFGEALTCGLIGGAIGAGINLVAYRSGANRGEMTRRALAGLVTGGFAGAIGVSLGHSLIGTMYGSRALGWALMGAGIGAAEGLYERSPPILRQGAFAAAVGGLIGGLPFGTVYSLLSRLSEAGGRAAAFVLFGAGVGASIGLAQAAFGGDLVRTGAHSIRFGSRSRRPRSGEKADRPLVSPEQVAQPKPDPVVVKPSRPAVSNTVKRQPTVMTPCPKCNRPVPGTRPYCVFCKISF